MRNAYPLRADRDSFRWSAWLPSQRRPVRGSDGSRRSRPANCPTGHSDSHREAFPDEHSCGQPSLPALFVAHPSPLARGGFQRGLDEFLHRELRVHIESRPELRANLTPRLLAGNHFHQIICTFILLGKRAGPRLVSHETFGKMLFFDHSTSAAPAAYAFVLRMRSVRFPSEE